MSYQVLARKWRPKVFREMVGQEHVLQALINALDHNRLHHAYLFTGTRGVGKTTIARILAKCLNCETGVSSEPCGQCGACVEIGEGRFVDLIEVDAASRTKVEDTRELLENVQYAPTRGRYKVYLIDEVHMLSSHSFNALLKTLEEPPPHIKFLLATTDPQKLPVTILSRCLQFNLKNMNPERIVQHLQYVLEQEMVPFEESALWQLGRAADGSMRDAMSLADQAIAFGSGKVSEAEVSAMLGTMDRALVYDILQALANSDGARLLDVVARLAEHAPDYHAALAELLAVLHRIAIAQALPEAVDNSFGDRRQVIELAQLFAAEDVQLFYQTALMGRRDLSLAPDPRGGFEMVLLRMLAFKPQGMAELPARALPQSQAPVPAAGAPAPAPPQSQPPPAPAQSAGAPAAQAAAPQLADRGVADEEVVDEKVVGDESVGEEVVDREVVAKKPAVSPAPVESPPAPEPVAAAVPAGAVPAPSTSGKRESSVLADVRAALDDPGLVTSAAEVRPQPAPAAARRAAAGGAAAKIPLPQAGPDNWLQIYRGLEVGGILQSTVSNCVLVGRRENALHFILDEANSTLYDEAHEARLADLLSDYFGAQVQVQIQAGPVGADIETPAACVTRLRRERRAQALQAMQTDPLVAQLVAQFQATLREGSVEPLD